MDCMFVCGCHSLSRTQLYITNLMCADFWMVILQQPGVCATHYLTKVSTEPVSSVSPQHICTMYQRRRSFESLKNTNMSYLLVCLHKFPPREGEPLERSHGVHTPAGTQRWVGSAGGEAGMRAKGRKRWETQRPEGAISCRGHTTVRCSCWGDTSVTMLYCTVFTFVL